MILLRKFLLKAKGKQIARSGIAGFFARILSMVSMLSASVILARSMGPDEYGIYVFALAVLTTVGVPVQLGLPTLIVRETANSRANQDWPLLRGIWKWSATVIFSSSLIVTFAILVWVFFWFSPDDSRRLAVLIGLPQITFLALGAARGAALRGLKHIFMGIFPDQIFRPLLMTFAVIVMWSLNVTITANLAMLVFVSVSFVALAFGIWVLSRATPKEAKLIKETKIRTRVWLRSIVPLSLIFGFNVINQNVGLLTLGWLASDDDVAFFRIALSLSSLAVFGLSVVNLFIQPYFAEAFSSKNNAKFQLLASASSLLVLSFTIPVVLIICFFGGRIINILYGNEYSAALLPLIVMLVGQSVSAFFGSVGNVLTMSGKEAHNMKILFIASTINIVLNIILVPQVGLLGSAISTSVSLVIINLLMWLAALRALGVDSSPFGLLRVANLSRNN